MVNPIGEKYSAAAIEFLEAHVGEVLDTDILEQLQSLITATECEFVGVTETGEMLGVSSQRVRQLNMPPEAGVLRAGVSTNIRFWLREDVRVFRSERAERRNPANIFVREPRD